MPPRSQLRATQVKDRAQLLEEFESLKVELDECPDDLARKATVRKIDDVLDQRLQQKGAHAPECDCHECWAAVSAVLTRRRLGELTDPRDVAEGEW